MSDINNMDILLDWITFLTRWLHVMAGVTWIGSSFYFNWFDSSVRPPKDKVFKGNVRGTLEEIHGGSFYYHEQYWPDQHPSRLLVHAWPAKTTFYSGLILMAAIYWLNPSVYLMDSGHSGLSGPEAVAISIISIVLAWFFYNKTCDLFKSDKHVFIAMSVAVVFGAYFFTYVFSGRGAFISMGVTLASLMGLNVIRQIVPHHIAMRKQLSLGVILNTHNGYLAKRRSQHNNFLTIPVVFCMISNHFALAYNSQFSWIILILLLYAGWAIRLTLNIYYKDENLNYQLIASFVSALAIAIGITVYQARLNMDQNIPSKVSIGDSSAMDIIKQKCTVCHAAKPTFPGFSSAPQGILLDNTDQVLKNRQKVHDQIASLAMPIGNVTKLEEADRKALIAWLKTK